MVGGGLGEWERRNGKAPIELGDESSTHAVITFSDSDCLGSTHAVITLSDSDCLGSTRAVITSSDSDCVGSIGAVQSRGDVKLKSAAIDLTAERQNQQVLDEEVSRLLSIFPNASPRIATADLASQLKKTSPGMALERVIHRYVEHGVPKAEQGPHEGPKSDPPQAVEKPTDAFARPNVHRAGTSNHGERQVDFGYEVLPPEITANYNLWTYYTLAKEFPRYPAPELRRVLHENNNWFAPSYKAISSDYAAALAAELRGQDRKRGRPQGYPKLNLIPRDLTPKPHEPCDIFERELQSIQIAPTEGAKLITELEIDTGPQCGRCMDASEGETSADIGCGCCSAYRFEDMIECAETHPFCFACSLCRIEEFAYIGSQASNSLSSMDTIGCEESFPWSEVETSEDAVVPHSI